MNLSTGRESRFWLAPKGGIEIMELRKWLHGGKNGRGAPAVLPSSRASVIVRRGGWGSNQQMPGQILLTRRSGTFK